MNVEPVVGALLLEAGAYSPVDLLLAMRMLSESDHRAWRRGDIHSLDAVVRGGTGAARSALESARSHADALGLTAKGVVHEGWGKRAGRCLRGFSEPTLDALLCTRYGRPSGAGQLDLFLDGVSVAAANALVETLLAHNAADAERQRARLAKVEPDHGHLAPASVLIAALRTAPPRHHAQALEQLGRLIDEWAPAAAKMFAGDAQDFLMPLWRGVADMLDAAGFDPQHPHRHASWAYRNALEWEAVKRAVRAVRRYAREPILVGRLAEAEWRLGDRLGAVRRWLELCRVAPDYFERLVESPDFPASALQVAWRQAGEQDFEPEISIEWFPAWLLLRARGLAHSLAPTGDPAGPGRAFDLVMALLTGDAGDVALRSELKAVHPALLASFLADAELTGEGSPRRFAADPLWPGS